MPLPALLEASATGLLQHVYLAEVTSVEDPNSLGRVEVRLYAFDGFQNQDAKLWARVAVPFAGGNRGAFFIPTVGDEVVVGFINGDSRFPIVLGSLWNGRAKPPDTIGGSSVDRWSITGKEGSKISIVEQSASTATVTLKTARGVLVEITDDSGGKVTVKQGTNSIALDSQGVTVSTLSNCTVKASKLQIEAMTVNIDAMVTTVKGLLKADIAKTTTVLSGTYQPGVGNIW